LAKWSLKQLPLEVPVEPRAAAGEHVAAPVKPVVAPVDKGSSPSEAPQALFFSRGLAFSPSGATTLPHINDACHYDNNKSSKSSSFI